MSDDALLMEYLEVTAVRRNRTVPIVGTSRETVERHVRWSMVFRWHMPGALGGICLVLLLVFAGALLAPLYAATALTVQHLAVNEVWAVRRSTAVLAYPAGFVLLPLVPYGLARRTFVRGNRRDRMRGKFDVAVIA